MRTSPEATIRYSAALLPPCHQPQLSVCHGVNHVVHSDANAERGIIFGIAGIVRPLPGIPYVRVEGHRHHDAAVIIVDATPVRYLTSLGASRVAIGDAARECPLAGNLVAVVEIVD